MTLLIIIFLLAVIISAAENGSFERKRQLEKNLLSNLQIIHTGGAVSLPTKEIRGYVGNSRIFALPFDIKQYFLTFLSPKDLLNVRLINRQYCDLADFVYRSLLSLYNPKFVLTENWMNFAFSLFLSNYFKNGRISTDDLFYAIEDILYFHGILELNAGKYPVSFSFLSFVYEHVNGIGSSLPLLQSDLYIEILAKVPVTIPRMNLLYLEFGCINYEAVNLSDEERRIRRDFISETIEFIATKPDPEALKAFFNFDPNLPLAESRLVQLPPFFQVALFNLILPLCEEEERFLEAIKIASSAFTFSQFLLDQLDEKFPEIADDIFEWQVTMFPAGKRALHKRGLRTNAIGLDYLLTRNTVNRFDLQELLQLNPDIPRLLSLYLPCNKLSLTEVDMMAQMQEAGLFDVIEDLELREKIASVISGIIRSDLAAEFYDILFHSRHLLN